MDGDSPESKGVNQEGLSMSSEHEQKPPIFNHENAGIDRHEEIISIPPATPREIEPQVKPEVVSPPETRNIETQVPSESSNQPKFDPRRESEYLTENEGSYHLLIDRDTQQVVARRRGSTYLLPNYDPSRNDYVIGEKVSVKNGRTVIIDSNNGKEVAFRDRNGKLTVWSKEMLDSFKSPGSAVEYPPYDPLRTDYQEREGSDEYAPLIDPKTGEVVGWQLSAAEGAQNLPLPLDLDAGGLTEVINAKIKQLEEHYEVMLQNPNAVLELADQILSYPRLATDLYPNLTPEQAAKNAEQLKNDLVEKAEKRLYLTLMNYQAIYDIADGFNSSMGYFGRSGLEYFGYKLDRTDKETEEPDPEKRGENLRIKHAITRLEDHEGEYYRFPTQAQKEAKKQAIINEIKTQLTTVYPNDPTLVEEKAKQSFDFAEKLMVIEGQATFYGGPTNPNGRLRELEVIEKMIADGVPGFSNTSVDMQSEEYWDEMERLRKEDGIRVIPPAIYGETLPVLNPLTGQSDTYAIGHGVQAIFSQAYFAPENLQINGYGNATHLRFATETRARSFVFFKHMRTLTQLIDSMEANPNTVVGLPEPSRWSGMINSARTLYDQFYREKPALLNVPFNNPNAAVKDPEKAFEAMSQYTEIAGAYRYLVYYGQAGGAAEEPFKARTALLKNMLWYISTGETEVREEVKSRFKWKKWGNNLVSAAADDLNIAGVIREGDYDVVMKKLGEDRWFRVLLGALDNGYREAGEGFGKFFVGLLKLFYQ